MDVVGVESARRHPGLRRRLNTVGLGNLIWERDITPQLKLCVDAVSISLNTADPAEWRRLHAPREAYAEQGFAAAQRFVQDCVRAGLETTVTAVRLPGVDLAAVERLARSLGAGFRLRPPLSEA
jgi:TatD DNase family protein